MQWNLTIIKSGGDNVETIVEPKFHDDGIWFPTLETPEKIIGLKAEIAQVQTP
jgi:hypothetical protein